MAQVERIRVLIADDENQLTRRLMAYVSDRGFEVRKVANGKDARSEILRWKPRFVLADLMLPEGNALSLIDFIKNQKSLRHKFIDVIVMSGHNIQENVKLSLARGAKDYIVKPIRAEDLVKRLVFHSRSYRHIKDLALKDFSKVDESSLMLHLTDLVMRQALGCAGLEEKLHNLTRMVAMKVEGVRCSIVHCVDQHLGYVVTSNDDRNASGIQLDLYKYPEILHVVNTQSLVAIENLDLSTSLRGVRDLTKEINFNSMIVCPVSCQAQPFGVLSLRMPPEKESISDNEIRFVEIVAHVVSLVLGGEFHKESGQFWLTKQTNAAIPILRQVKNP